MICLCFFLSCHFVQECRDKKLNDKSHDPSDICLETEIHLPNQIEKQRVFGKIAFMLFYEIQ